jgi:hypothetical protein
MSEAGWDPDCRLGCASGVAMMQPADPWNGDDFPSIARLALGPESATQNARSVLGQLGAFGLALQNGQLLSQGEVLENKLPPRLQA